MTYLNLTARCRPAHPGSDADRARAHALPRRVTLRALAARKSDPRLTDPRLTAPLLADGTPVPLGEPQFAFPAHDNDGIDNGLLAAPTGTTRTPGKPHVLHVDSDDRCAEMVAAVLAPEVHVTRVSTLTDARRAIANDIYSLVIIDPRLPDGNGATLVAALADTPVLVHAETSPMWRERVQGYLAKPWSTHRAMWIAVAGLLGLSGDLAAEG